MRVVTLTLANDTSVIKRANYDTLWNRQLRLVCVIPMHLPVHEVHGV